MADDNITAGTLEEADGSREVENLRKVEAALFVAGRFLSVQELVALTDLNPILLNHSLGKLSEKYDDKSAIEVVNQNDLWKMDVRGQHRDIVNRLATGSAEFTKAEQETLAIIAYKQPIKQSSIITVRGNKAYDHIHKLIDVGLVKSKRVGRTCELKLSDDFYDYFNVERGKVKEMFAPFEKVPKHDQRMAVLSGGSESSELEEIERGVRELFGG